MRASPFLFALLLAAGCAPPDAEVRLARVAAEGRNLETTFDRLEERLLANQARVRLWREMRERHESVSAVACVSQEDHAREMASRGFHPAEHSSLHRARVATAAGAEKAVIRTTSRK